MRKKFFSQKYVSLNVYQNNLKNLNINEKNLKLNENLNLNELFHNRYN